MFKHGKGCYFAADFTSKYDMALQKLTSPWNPCFESAVGKGGERAQATSPRHAQATAARNVNMVSVIFRL